MCSQLPHPRACLQDSVHTTAEVGDTTAGGREGGRKGERERGREGGREEGRKVGR